MSGAELDYFDRMAPRVIFHIDMDAFFASIEQRDTPEYAGRPVIVGARPGTRGVVSASSYEARKFGVRSAMPISEAVRRCPQGVFVRPRMGVYSRESRAIMAILDDFSPDIEQISVDEAFVDMTGTEKLFGPPLEAARAMVGRIRNERRLTASVGIAPNKFLAKIASDLNKPAGLTLAPFEPDAVCKWLAPMPVGRIWGVGRKTNELLHAMGVITIADLQQLSREFLVHKFGKYGEDLVALCRGEDERPVGGREGAKSVSREHTYNVDSPHREEWKKTLFLLAQDVARHARRDGVKGATVVLIYRKSDFSKHTKRKPLGFSTNAARFIYEAVLELLDQVREPALRLIGVGLTSLNQEEQTDLFVDERPATAHEAAESAMDRIEARFGANVIAKGREFDGAKSGKPAKPKGTARQ